MLRWRSGSLWVGSKLGFFFFFSMVSGGYVCGGWLCNG